MAGIDILAKYGIKEVADVVFYELSEAGLPQYPVLYLDTLKVSTIEQTAESSDARGGKGNAALISWDYGKEINVTLEDALFSAKSMAIMFGNGNAVEYNDRIMKTEQFVCEALGTDATDIPQEAKKEQVGNTIKFSVIGGWNQGFSAPDGKVYAKTNPKFYNAKGLEIAFTKQDATADAPAKVAWADCVGKRIFCSYDLMVEGAVIEVSADSFPGTYYVTGDTYARSEASGKDEFFQFIIPKAKVQSENTITLEAEGDPSVFNMSLKVLRPADGKMMKLVKYNLNGDSSDATADSVNLYHNHVLITNNMADLQSNG